jgi:N-acetyl-gamma-glutamyl-phosphate reductase
VIKIGIVGGTGYTGVELLRLLAQHPEADVQVITSRGEAGMPVAQLFPNLRGRFDLAFSAPDVQRLKQCDVVFFATPHGVAQAMMAELLDQDALKQGVRVIDLSADFRIRDIALWEKWYGQKHACPELVAEAVYGLAEVNRADIANARLVACAGCYPTAVQLGFLPLLEAGLVRPDSLIANAASGVSGAGRQAKVDMLFPEVSDSFKAYASGGHRHLPEIEQGLRAVQSGDVAPVHLTFVPHLVPMVRGIHATLYADLLDTGIDLQALYESRYADEYFVDVLPAGSHPETRSVKGSNYCRLSVVRPQGRNRVVIMSVIDNLTKGASGQAVQIMNIMFGIPEYRGLENLALLP